MRRYETGATKGSIEFDCALLMRGIDHEWHGKADLCFAAGNQPREALQPTP
jgi:hypothetical protein